MGLCAAMATSAARHSDHACRMVVAGRYTRSRRGFADAASTAGSSLLTGHGNGVGAAATRTTSIGYIAGGLSMGTRLAANHRAGYGHTPIPSGTTREPFTIAAAPDL